MMSSAPRGGDNVIPFPAKRRTQSAVAKPVSAMTPAEKKALIRFLIRDIARMVDGGAA